MTDGQVNSVREQLARARRAADIGDVSHTVLHSREALFGALQHLADEVEALREELAAQRVKQPRVVA